VVFSILIAAIHVLNVVVFVIQIFIFFFHLLMSVNIKKSYVSTLDNDQAKL